MLAVTAANGVRLQLHDGEHHHEVIDAMASWWCQIHGYRNPVLDEALNRQSSQFSHVMFGGLTHKAAVDAVMSLVRLAPGPLDRIFLADSGSVGVEVSLKLARQVQIARTAARGGTLTRTRVAALRGAYHGDTLGAMSVCDPIGGMHAMSTVAAAVRRTRVACQRINAFELHRNGRILRTKVKGLVEDAFFRGHTFDLKCW